MSWSGWSGGALVGWCDGALLDPCWYRSLAVVGFVSRPTRPEPTMTLPRTVADVLANHMVFEVECIDRMSCNVYVPKLQFAAGLLADVFSAAMRRFARVQRVPWVDFVKGARKDEVMHEHLARFTDDEGVLFIGRAQEKTALFRTERRRDTNDDSYPWIVKTTGVVNHFYVDAVDAEFGPFFLKFCSYFPYNAKLCLKGHEWAKRQATRAGIAFTALDNGFATVEDPAALQAICDRWGPGQIDALLRKWLAILPHPFTPADREAGYRYDISILQAEFSLTQVLDQPVSGRVFFEHVIRDNLDAGRPDRIGLVFNRRLMTTGPRPTPGRFRTRVITESLTPSLYIISTTSTPRSSNITSKDEHSAHQTTINNTRDFEIGKRLTNLPALRQVGFSANRRLLGVQRLEPQPDPRRASLHRRPPPDHHQQRTPHRRATPRRPPRPCAAPSTAGIRAAP
jgi:hypothetical protein